MTNEKPKDEFDIEPTPPKGLSSKRPSTAGPGKKKKNPKQSAKNSDDEDTGVKGMKKPAEVKYHNKVFLTIRS